ncbi:protein zntD-like isoform X2 [Hyalella azteca]|uniref:Protein zntD-like isoform X2 n=1 Tax=Hyalella azteca TaxID=294128 RepID=A0A979FIG0_HYAAZ|nr:protein zntD-like isoform X2 [Hyalella azteca]
MDLLTVKLLSMLLLGLLSLFFGLIPLKIQKKLMKTNDAKSAETQQKQRRRRDLAVSCLLCFGAGVLLATVFLHMLPETRENIEAINAKIAKSKHSHEALHDHGDHNHEALHGDHNHDHELSHAHNDHAHEDHAHKDHVHEDHAHENITMNHGYANNSEVHHAHADHDHGDHGHEEGKHATEGPSRIKNMKANLESEKKNIHVHKRSVDAAGITHDKSNPITTVGIAATTENVHLHHTDHDHIGNVHGSLHDSHDHGAHHHEHEDNESISVVFPPVVPSQEREGLIESVTENAAEGSGGTDPILIKNLLEVHKDNNRSFATGEANKVLHDAHDHAGHLHHDNDDTHAHGEVNSVDKHGHGNASHELDNSTHDHNHHHDINYDNHSTHNHDHDHADSETQSNPVLNQTDTSMKTKASRNELNDRNAQVHDHAGHIHDHTGHIHDHTGHIHDHAGHTVTHGPYDRTHTNLEHDQNSPLTNDSPHSTEGDHKHDIVLNLNQQNSNAAIQKLMEPMPANNSDNTSSNVPDKAHVHEEHDHADDGHSYPLAELFICIGFFFVYIIEEIIHKVVFRTHSHATSKKASSEDDSMVLKNRFSDANKLPPITNGTYRSRSLSNVAENGQVGSSDLSNGGNLPPKDSWATTGVDNPSFIAENDGDMTMQMSRPSVTPSTAGHGHSHMVDMSSLKARDWVNNLRSLIIVLALSFHAVFEGLAVGLQQNVADVWYLFYAIAAHKFVIAFCVGLELISGGTKLVLTVVYMITFAMVTPLGIAIGIVVTEGIGSPNSLSHLWTVTVLQGMAGGTILYVTFCEVLERERNRKNGRFSKLAALIVGFATMALIQLVGGHKHTH